jgi:hypothetical protein
MRLKQYTMEELLAGELVGVRVNHWEDTYTVEPLTITRHTAKTIYYTIEHFGRTQAGQLLVDRAGYVSFRLYCLKEDIPGLIEEYKKRTLEDFENQIADIKEKMELTKNLKEKTKEEVK